MGPASREAEKAQNTGLWTPVVRTKDVCLKKEKTQSTYGLFFNLWRAVLGRGSWFPRGSVGEGVHRGGFSPPEGLKQKFTGLLGWVLLIQTIGTRAWLSWEGRFYTCENLIFRFSKDSMSYPHCQYAMELTFHKNLAFPQFQEDLVAWPSSLSLPRTW